MPAVPRTADFLGNGPEMRSDSDALAYVLQRIYQVQLVKYY